MSKKEHISVIPPMKKDFESKFMIGNIFNPDDVSSSQIINPALVRHYNALTAENQMKPCHISPNSRGSYDFTDADNMVNAAVKSGFKVIGHTLLWHSQNSSWINKISSLDKNAALEAMREYITDVIGHFKGKIYSWDVINEAFPDSVSSHSDWKTSIRSGNTGNPWFTAIGCDFVYESFLAARLADPDAVLYYNDFNTDQPFKAEVIRDMVRDVNKKYLTSNDKPSREAADRLLIEGIGMQEHHNISVTADAVRKTLNLFKPLGVKISVSELDVMIIPFEEFESYGYGHNKQNLITGEKKISGLKKQAQLFGEYFKIYLEFSDIIERVSFWGIKDDKSWRSSMQPLLFDSDGNAKDAYYSVIESLKQN